MNNELIRDLLNNYIKKYGTSKAHVAREIGVSRNTVSQFCLGKRNVSKDTLARIKDYIFRN